MRAVVFVGAGGNEVVELRERPDPSVGPDDVLVGVTVAGMNPADLQQRAGHYPAPPGAVPDVPGLELAGEVLETGSRVSAFTPGDRVFGLVAGGGLAERVAVHERCVTRVPDRLDAEEAAAAPEAFITGHDALVQGELRPGENVLVQGATGAVGAAAVQIADASGASVLAPAPPHEVLERTGGRGVDLVLELVGAANLADDMAMLALQGRIIVLSVASGAVAELDLLRLMTCRAAIRGTVLRARPLDEKAAAVQRFAHEVVPMLEDGRATPSIDSVFSADDVHRAFDRLGERGKSGKVLLRFD
ncbi:MAG TPA: zinc-binding dehydrogenase [Actinomycetota bacterium]|nr:zinc-binding dehydrogenase [Actinomycetota bacterium]